MAYVDEVFQRELIEIINSGHTDTDVAVRPKWEDGSPAHTRAKFGLYDVYDLSKEFPLMSLRPVAFKKAVDEIFWIYQKKSNKLSDLDSHIWDQWADENGTIGKAYGYQVGQKYRHHPWIFGENSAKLDELIAMYPSASVEDGWVWLDQMDAVLWDIRNNPGSRRIMINLYNHADLADMRLAPCCYSCTFRVQGDTLNMLMNQRSSDMIVAHGWNVAQYAALQVMVAKATGLKPGLFAHMVVDAHIYDRHMEIAGELLKRNPTIDGPLVTFTPKTNNFYDFSVDDFHVEAYNHYPQIKNIPVAE